MHEKIQVGGASAVLLRPFARAASAASKAGATLRLAVSGGIGSGKSTVTAVLARRGAVVADADQIARDLQAPGSPLLGAIAKRFGPSVLTPSPAPAGAALDAPAAPDAATLDRAALARIVFSDSAAKADLDAIMHPAIWERAEAILASAHPGQLAVYDVPLLIETRADRHVDAVLIVSAPLEARLDRLERRGISRADATARIQAQTTDAARRELAHIWLDNAGTKADLEQLTAAVADAWL